MKIETRANMIARYTSISRRQNERRITRVSRHWLRPPTSQSCLSFSCPRSNSGTRLNVLASNRCPVTEAVNLKPSDTGLRFRYTQTLSTEDINAESGLYTSRKDCMKGNNVAFTFCGTKKKQVEILSQSSATKQLQQTEDIDVDVTSPDQLRKLLPDDMDEVDYFLSSSDGKHQESKNERLIVLIESVLETLKDLNAEKQYSTQHGSQTPQEKAEEEGRGESQDSQKKTAYAQSYRESDIKELENALKKLN